MQAVEGVIRSTWLLAVGLVLLGAILSVSLMRWGRGVSEVARGIDRLRRTRRPRPVLMRVWGPVGDLIRMFNQAGPEIAERIADLERDGQRLRVVLGAMAEAVIAVDGRFRLLLANTSALSLFGLGPSSEGRLIPELIRSPRVQEVIEETFRLTSPDAQRAEITVTSPATPK